MDCEFCLSSYQLFSLKHLIFFWQLHGMLSWDLKRQVTKSLVFVKWGNPSERLSAVLWVSSVRASSGDGCAAGRGCSFHSLKCFTALGPINISLISETFGSWISKDLLNMIFLDTQTCLYRNLVKFCLHNGCWGNRYTRVPMGVGRCRISVNRLSLTGTQTTGKLTQPACGLSSG